MTDRALEQPNPRVEPTVSRRAFLEASVGLGGALFVGFYVPSAGAAPGVKGVFAPNAFIRIDKSGRITLIMPQVEMGQGIYTAIVMILAEELDAAFNEMSLEAAPPSDKLYGNPTFGIQVTGNSNSIRAFWVPLRKAAAGARAMLVEAAAQIWKANPTSIRTEASTAIHEPSGRRLAYGALVDRGVGPNNNVFAIESFMDELAKKSNKDPVAFRRDLLGKTPRLKAALELAAEKAGWGTPLPARTGRGVALQTAFGSFIATVAQATVDGHGEVRVERIVSAVDTGIVVNPDTVIAQLQGGLAFGLTAALYGSITIDKGRVQQSNFNNYRMLRINEMPQIEVYLIKSGEAPGGIGETGTTAAPPALVNALAAATGIRLRRLPVDREVLSGRKSA